MKKIARIVTILSLLLLMSMRCSLPAEATEVPVRYAEGTVHGFLILRNNADSVLGYGDLLQTVDGLAVSSKMVFRFGDGSHFEERVNFSQKGVFQMQSYALEMRGPTFENEQQITLERASGKYRVETKSGRDGKVELHEGVIEVPTDVYNGMVVTIAKNLTKQPGTRVHFVAFMPKPRLIEIELVAANAQQVMWGSSAMNAMHFVVKPRLGAFVGAIAKLFGKLPPDNHTWILTDDVPAFIRAEGPIFMNGPVWRIELAAPRWPKTAGD